MDTIKTCKQCLKPVPAGAPESLCPECLAKVALGSEPSAGGQRIPPNPADLAAQFPQLEIIELLGMGGMGMVYKARQPKLDRFVALKILPMESDRDASFAERFAREARALAMLNHSGIVAVYDFGQTKDYYYLVMEYVDGMNLRQLLEMERISPHQALDLVMQICTALQYAHDQKIVHRDIKPANILINKSGQAKIADFGLAKLLGTAPDTSLTATQTVMGTINYMAPEQREKPLEVDHRADIYSLGVVFYEMLTGEVPMGRFEAPSKIVQVDVRLDEVVLHALEREPSRRYQKASEVRTGVETIASTMNPSSGQQGGLGPEKGGQTAAIPLPRIGPSVARLFRVLAVVVVMVGSLAAGWHWKTRTAAARVAEEKRQAAEARIAQLGPRWTNSLGMVFVPVPGTSASFSIWDTRVQDFTVFASETGYQNAWIWTWRNSGANTGGHWCEGGWSGPETARGPLYPVCGICWDDAQQFCHWLTDKEHKSGVLKSDLAYRLPKEEEWSVVFGSSQYPWGDQWPPPSGAGNYANWTIIPGNSDNFTRTSPVGSFPPNAFGLYDVGGNVWQFSEDLYGTNFSDCVLRGGSWSDSSPSDLQSSHRYTATIGDHWEVFGFRCVISGVESNAQAAALLARNILGEIHNAARDGDLATVQVLLKKNPDLINSKDKEGDTPLLWAACRDQKNVVEFLLASNADVNAADKEGLAPLHWAASRGYKDVAELLLASNAPVNARDHEGLTPLHWAADKGYKETAELLLANKAEINATDHEGLTPLHWAADRGYEDVVKLLLANKADANARDNEGRTPLRWATMKGHEDVTELLRQSGGNE